MEKRHMTKEEVLSAAAMSFIKREKGTERPVGKIKYGWKWYPLTEEKCNFCGDVSTPSRAWPHTLLDHCLSPEHVARLHGVTTAALLGAAEVIKKAEKAV